MEAWVMWGSEGLCKSKRFEELHLDSKWPDSSQLLLRLLVPSCQSPQALNPKPLTFLHWPSSWCTLCPKKSKLCASTSTEINNPYITIYPFKGT